MNTAIDIAETLLDATIELICVIPGRGFTVAFVLVTTILLAFTVA